MPPLSYIKITGALYRFVVKEQQISVEIQNADVEVLENVSANVETQNIKSNVDGVEIRNVDVEILENASVDVETQNINSNVDDVDVEIQNLDVKNGEDDNMEDNDNDNVEQANPFDHSLYIFDPSTWNALDSKMIDLLVEKDPKRYLSIVRGPKDKFSKCFTANLYTKTLSNGEKCDKDWLVYSKELDRVFCCCCCCCKVFQRESGRGQY